LKNSQACVLRSCSGSWGVVGTSPGNTRAPTWYFREGNGAS
jgi:hypothetical protein